MASDVWYIKWTREGRVYLMGKIQKIKELTEELLYHCHLYYDLDAPEISDAEYDKKFDELKHLEDEANFWLANSPTRKVQGQVLSSLTKVHHSVPMLSANKSTNLEDVEKFVGTHPVVVSYKMDGATLVAKFSEGKFVQALSRGSGIDGEDITHTACMIKNLPMTIPYRGYLEIRGEALIPWKYYNAMNINGDLGHPRNIASGALRQLNANEAAKRNIYFYAFTLVNWKDVGVTTKAESLNFLVQNGFDVVSNVLFPTYGSLSDCISHLNREKYELPTDGWCFEYNDLIYGESLGSTGHHNRKLFALKPGIEEYETILRNIEWTLGKTGQLTPTAVFDPVEIDNTIVTKASVHNISIIKNLNLRIGGKCSVYKANMIIPQILGCIGGDAEIEIPWHCPICGGSTEIVKDNESEVLMCSNPNCVGKRLALFEYFVSKKALNIDGLSEATIEFLINKGWIHTFKDLYHLIEYKSEWQKCDGFGKKSVEKILDAIEKSRNVDLAHFITALSIPGIGSSAAKTISEACNGSWDILWDMWNHEYDFTQLDDIGEITADSLVKFFNEHINDINRLSDEMHFIIEEKKEIQDNPFIGKSICCTGKLEHFTRDSINEKIVELGAKVASGVTSKTDFLINNDPNSNSSKNNNARKFGTKIITEEEFLNLIGG